MKWTATLAVAAALMHLNAVQSACVDPWIEFGAVCFYFLEAKATWNNARSLCQDLYPPSSDLAVLTGDLHHSVIEYINDQPAGDLDDEAFWIGGYATDNYGSWEWVADAGDIPMGPPHWYPCNGQPNNPTTQHYLALYTPDFYFHSLEQERQIMAICQQA